MQYESSSKSLYDILLLSKHQFRAMRQFEVKFISIFFNKTIQTDAQLVAIFKLSENKFIVNLTDVNYSAIV